MNRLRLRAAARASGLHLLGSFAVAAVAAWLVFGRLYPTPYAEMLGGFELFFILMGVDVVCGPLLTLVLFNPAKPRRELVLDLGFVAILQLGALAYGLQTVWLARPVYLIYDVDRFQVLTMSELDEIGLAKKPAMVPSPSWLGGPVLIGSRTAKPEDVDYLDQVNQSLAGNEAFMRADRWGEYSNFQHDVLSRAQALDVLYGKHPSQKLLLDNAVLNLQRQHSQVSWLPVVSRRGIAWTLLMDSTTAQPLKFVPLDGF